MLKKLSIKYFEGYEEAEIDFSDGLNLIIGDSNSGKSSIIRALGVVCDNLWQKDMVRTGHTYCQIRLDTSVGWVECKRGEGVNEWTTFDGETERSYRSIGATVPEETSAILGIGRKSWGEISDMPNFMFQLDKHFMLSEIDGKRASPNLVARMMDNAIGLGGMEELIKALSSDLSRDKKSLTDKASQISELKGELIDDVIYDFYCRSMEDCRRLYVELDELSSSYSEAVELYGRYRGLLDVLESFSARSIADFDVVAAESSLAELSGLGEAVESLVAATSALNRLPDWPSIGLCTLEAEHADLGRLCAFLDSCLELAGLERRMASVIDGCSLPIDDLADDLDGLQSLVGRYSELGGVANSLSATRRILCGIRARMDIDDKSYQSAECRLGELMVELGVCPLCGGAFCNNST